MVLFDVPGLFSAKLRRFDSTFWRYLLGYFYATTISERNMILENLLIVLPPIFQDQTAPSKNGSQEEKQFFCW